ncbi:MAG: type II secretion system F family protein [Phycisphaerae bacterium]|nr:type II secretion system F family protein [Phycisphaerae bacterium]
MARDSKQAGTMLEGLSSSSATVTEKSKASQPQGSERKFPSLPSRDDTLTAVSRSSRQVKYRAISRNQAIYIATQLSVMIDTGVTLPEALEGLARQSDESHVRAALRAIQEKVKGGSDLSLAVARCPYRFPRIFACLLRASEASGTMALMLSRVAEYLTEENENVRKIQSALIYPAVMFVLALLTAVLMITFLLPRFATIYRGHEDVLPLPTRVAFALSDLFLANWIYIIIAVVLLTGGLIIYLRSNTGRVHTDWLKLHMPLLGRMFRKFYLARSIRTIGTMIGAGRTVPEAVRLARGITGNSYFNSLWKRADDSLQVGAQLSDPLFLCPLIPNAVAQMIATGEKTGRLALVMERIASFCESDLHNTVKNVATILEPLMIIIMGMFIAGIAMAVLLPVFSISKVLGSG